jgi:hypothetical protein
MNAQELLMEAENFGATLIVPLSSSFDRPTFRHPTRNPKIAQSTFGDIRRDLLPIVVEPLSTDVFSSSPKRFELDVSASLVAKESRYIHSLCTFAPFHPPIMERCDKNLVHCSGKGKGQLTFREFHPADESILCCSRSQQGRQTSPDKTQHVLMSFISVFVVTFHDSVSSIERQPRRQNYLLASPRKTGRKLWYTIRNHAKAVNGGHT